MADGNKKMLTLALLACVAVLCAASNAALAEGPSAEKMLQPQALNQAGIYRLRQFEPALTGSGVKFAVICRSITYINGEPQNDYRPAIGHNCFKAGKFGFHDQAKLPAGTSAHSTAICSILLGQDPNASHPHLGRFYYQGAAPQAEAEVYEFWHFLINNVFGHSPPDADIITVGIGSQFEDWWTRSIEALAEHYGTVIVAGVGNGSDAHDPLLYPGAAANVIGVGVVDSVNTENLATNLAEFSLAYPEHSSLGPTEEARCKPDIVAPGNCLAANGDEPNRYEPTGDWSSFATPIVAGTIGLLTQKAGEEPNLTAAISPNGGNCVIKAILLNSATKLPYWHKGLLTREDDHQHPLDYIQGAGTLNALGAYKHLVAGPGKPGAVSTIGWDNNILPAPVVTQAQVQKGKNPQNIYKITLTEEPADISFTATVVWNRHYNSAYPFDPLPEKDTNLRLELWAVDPNNPNNDYLLDYSDSNTDNLEHIYSSGDANYTSYEIIVSINDTTEPNKPGTAERYGLAWNISNEPAKDSIFWYDLNADGIVNELDFTILVDNWMAGIKAPDSYLLGDINTDGAIDANDLQILLSRENLEAPWHTK